MKCITRASAVALAIASLVGCVSTATQSVTPPAVPPTTTGAPTGATTDLNGTWRGMLSDPEGQKHAIELTFTVNGNSVTGTFMGAPPEGMTEPLKGPIRNGKLEGNQLTFMTSFGEDGPPIAFKGTVHGTLIRGLHGSPDMGLDMQWEVSKQ
jgi:hypothetical protein